MDIFVEQLVSKKKTAKNYAAILGCLVGVFVILGLFVFVILPVVSKVVPFLNGLTFLLLFGLIYLFYRLVSNTNMEFEYCFTNGALDVDKIFNRRSRKKFVSLNARSIERMASTKDSEFASLLKNAEVKKLYGCSDVKASDTYYVVFSNEKGRQMLLFNPNEKIRDGFKRFNPQKVFLDD